MKFRLRWDCLYTEWTELPNDWFSKEPQPIVVRLEPPTNWKFDLEMLKLLDGRVAVESTLLLIEIQP